MIFSGISASIASCIIIGLILGLLIGRLIFSGKTITEYLTQPNIFGFRIHSSDSPFINALERTTSKVQDVVQGSMCNVLHDPSIMDQIIKQGRNTDAKCSDVIEELANQRDRLKKALNISEKTLENDSDVTKIKTIFYNEIVQLQKDIVTKYCPTGKEEITPSDFKKMVENARTAVCSQYKITPKTFQQFVDDTIDDLKENSPLGDIYKDEDFERAKKEVSAVL
jgi:hypothetical protein